VSAARVLTVSTAQVAGGDDPGGRLVVRALLAEGLPVASRQLVDEDEAALESALVAALSRPGLVVVLAAPGGSGGELVRRMIARLAGVRLVLSERFLEAMEGEYAARGQAMPRRMDRLALLPQGAQVWLAAPGGEPGWMLEAEHGPIAVLPAGSARLGDLIDQHLRPLAPRVTGPGERRLVRTLRATGIAPADAEERLGRWLGRDGEVAVSCVPVDGDVWVRLAARGASRALAASALARVEALVEQALGDDCYGRDDETLEFVVGRLLQERGLMLSVAESCTGGLLGHRITGVPGSSRYFERGVLVYSNAAKQELIRVPEDLLRAHGAVSAPVAEAMVKGVAGVGRSACALAITGVAGPDGGTPDKPVGTVFVGALSPGGTAVRRFRFSGDREAVKWQSTQAALDMLRRALLRADGRTEGAPESPPPC
jgi:nicotinamide-nucleotide amidase